MRKETVSLAPVLVVLAMATLGCPNSDRGTFTLYVVNATDITTESLTVYNSQLDDYEQMLPQGGDARDLYKLVLDHQTYTGERTGNAGTYALTIILSDAAGTHLMSSGRISVGEEKALFIARDENGFGSGAMGLIDINRKAGIDASERQAPPR